MQRLDAHVVVRGDLAITTLDQTFFNPSADTVEAGPFWMLAASGLLLAPWFLASPSDFVHDTITLLLSFHPIKFANTLFIAAQTELGVTPPFWLTGVIVLGKAGVAARDGDQHQRDNNHGYGYGMRL